MTARRGVALAGLILGALLLAAPLRADEPAQNPTARLPDSFAEPRR